MSGALFGHSVVSVMCPSATVHNRALLLIIFAVRVCVFSIYPLFLSLFPRQSHTEHLPMIAASQFSQSHTVLCLPHSVAKPPKPTHSFFITPSGLLASLVQQRSREVYDHGCAFQGALTYSQVG